MTSGLLGCKSVMMNRNNYCKMQLDYTDKALIDVNMYNRTMIKSQYDFCH